MNDTVVLSVVSLLLGVVVYVVTKTYMVAVEVTKMQGNVDQNKKDINGLGERLRLNEMKADERIRQNESKLFYYAFITCPEDKRVTVADAFTRRMN